MRHTDKTQPNFFLTEDAFQTLVGGGNWKIKEIPLNVAAEEIKDHFGINTSFCVFASGTSIPPQSGMSKKVVAGIDWVRQEDKRKHGETELNIYHYIILAKTEDGYPVFHFGANDTVAPHRSELEDLKIYFKDWK